MENIVNCHIIHWFCANNLCIMCFSLWIVHDLSVFIWINDIKLHLSELSWLLGYTKGKLALWSQLSNLLTRYASNIVEPDSLSTCHIITTAVEELGVTISKQSTCSFLAEQIRLLCTSPKTRRYSVDMIINRFSFIIEVVLLIWNYKKC